MTWHVRVEERHNRKESYVACYYHIIIYLEFTLCHFILKGVATVEFRLCLFLKRNYPNTVLTILWLICEFHVSCFK